MNALFYRYGSICEPDIIAGFEELGIHVSEITVEIYNKNVLPADGVRLLTDELFARMYDFVFSINFYPFISDVCNIFHLRYICWTVDSPVVELYSTALEHPWNRIFLFDLAQYHEFVPSNPECIFYLPLASNPARWNTVIENAAPSQISRFTGDISFVGSLYTEKCPYDNLTDAPAYLRGYLDSIMAAQQKVYGYYFLEELLPDSIVDAFCTHFSDFYVSPYTTERNDRAILAQYYLSPKISAMERVRTMKLLGEHYPVNLYTGSDSNGLPVRNCGLVKTLTEMPLIFRHSKINLNITSKSIRSGLPLRLFDVLGCRGFLLTNYQCELTDYFTPGCELDFYTCEDELLEKVDYYLSHEKERLEIAQNGFECILKHHTYPMRLLEMLSLAYDQKKR